MKTIISQKAVEIIADILNRQETARQLLREAEARTEAARNYMMADPSIDNALELHNAMKQAAVRRQQLADLDKALEHAALRDFYTL